MSIQRKLPDTTELPRPYREHRTVDFKHDKKFSVAVQAIFVLMALVALGVALLFPLSLGTDWRLTISIPVTLFACLLYMAAHEATHGLFLQLMTKVRPSYAVRFPFLTTGSHAYLTRRSAVVVALAPSVIWGIVLIAALLTLPQDYLLTAYILLALNFAGSAGGYLISRRGLPKVGVVWRFEPCRRVKTFSTPSSPRAIL